MIRYKDLKYGGYDTLRSSYRDNYSNPDSSYYGNPRLVKDPRMLQHVSLASLGLSVQAVKGELMGLGLSLTDPATNKPYPEALYNTCIEEATNWAEQLFDIVVRPRVVHERDDYNKTDYYNYGYIQMNEKPVIQINDIRLMFNNNTVQHFPDDWIKVNNLFGDYRLLPTALFAQTTGGMMMSPTIISPTGGNIPGEFPYGNSNFAPGMVGTTAICGFLPRDPRDKGITRSYYLPYDLKALICKKAAIFILQRWGRTVLRAGISGYGVTIDGIHSDIQSTQSPTNTGSSADIKLLNSSIQSLANALRSYFGVNMATII